MSWKYNSYVAPNDLDSDGFPLPHRCEQCAHFTIDAHRLYSRQSQSDHRQGSSDYALSIGADVFDPANIQSDSCALFRSLRWAYSGHAYLNPSKRLIDGPAYIRFKTSSRRPEESTKSLITSAECEIKYISQDLHESPVPARLTFAARSKDGDPSAPYAICGRPHWDPGSVQFASIAMKWVDECRGHKRCPSLTVNPLPTRTLHVLGGLKLHVSSESELGQFNALSYCWGGQHPIVLTKETIEVWKTGIPEHKLPQTLKDAIVFTRRLGVEHLWIDALCIVQDDPDDIANEIPKMPQIYGYAFVTIAAARAKSSTEGFLQPRDISEPWRHSFSLPIHTMENQIGHICFYPAVRVHYKEREEPIHSRAWTLQEYVLSPRIIEFGSSCIRWICKSNKFVEGLWGNNAYNILYKNLFAGFDGNLLLHGSGARRAVRAARPKGRQHSVQDGLWNDLVNTYTARKLTDPNDRAHGIAGIAHFYRELTGSSYWAGIWSHDPSHFLWRCTNKLRPNERCLKTLIRQPSWSWFAVDDPVFFPYVSTTDFTVIGCDVEPLFQSAPFGAVKKAVLTVEARLRRIHLTNKDSTGSIDVRLEQDPQSSLFRGHVFWNDDIEAGNSDAEFWLMAGGHGHSDIIGLILATDNTDELYRRVGWFGLGLGYEISHSFDMGEVVKTIGYRTTLFKLVEPKILNMY